jgi:hypothetical protein
MGSVTPWPWATRVFLGVDRLVYTRPLSTEGLGGDAYAGNGPDVWVGAYNQQVFM